MVHILFYSILISIIFSLHYKYLKEVQYRHHPFHREVPAKIHAFAIEVIQLLLLIVGLWPGGCAVILTISPFPKLGSAAPVDSAHSWLLASASAILYALAIVATDSIDNMIQVGVWQHPFQCQILLLTRNAVLPWTVKRLQLRVSVPVSGIQIATPAFSDPFLLKTPRATSKSTKEIRQARKLGRIQEGVPEERTFGQKTPLSPCPSTPMKTVDAKLPQWKNSQPPLSNSLTADRSPTSRGAHSLSTGTNTCSTPQSDLEARAEVVLGSDGEFISPGMEMTLDILEDEDSSWESVDKVEAVDWEYEVDRNFRVEHEEVDDDETGDVF